MGVVTVPVWFGFEEMEEMALVGVEVVVLLDDDKTTEEHLGLLFESR